MSKGLWNINISQIGTKIEGKDAMNLDGDFILKEVKYDEFHDFMRHPMRFDGYLGLFCISGSFSVELNMRRYKVAPNSFLVCVPGYIISLPDPEEALSSKPHFVVVAMSRDYIPSIKIDITKIWGEGMRVLETPVITMEKKENELCKKFMSLALDVMRSDLPDKREAISHLIASSMIVFGQMWMRKISNAKQTAPPASSRDKMVFEQFLRMVTEYHTSQRGMNFYAERMNLTPKYLSKLIKRASGRSAPDWIDSFVVLEAKNMLKYSDAPIKEIVFKLNFVNQSVFYKFFKSHTGMTPSEYRNS